MRSVCIADGVVTVSTPARTCRRMLSSCITFCSLQSNRCRLAQCNDASCCARLFCGQRVIISASQAAQPKLELVAVKRRAYCAQCFQKLCFSVFHHVTYVSRDSLYLVVIFHVSNILPLLKSIARVLHVRLPHPAIFCLKLLTVTALVPLLRASLAGCEILKFVFCCTLNRFTSPTFYLFLRTKRTRISLFCMTPIHSLQYTAFFYHHSCTRAILYVFMI